MINEKQLNKFCCEDISLIENYEKAIADTTQTWDCHHKKEDEGYSQKQLKEMELYFERPASELILLTHAEHSSLHHKNKKCSENTKRKMSESHKGQIPWNKNKSYNKGIPKSEETKRKMSESQKGHKAWNKGKTSWNKGVKTSEETKQKISEKMKLYWENKRKSKNSDQIV